MYSNDSQVASRRARSIGMASTAMTLVLAFAGQAAAQVVQTQADAEAPVQAAQDDVASVGDIVVTGTSIRGIKPVGSATVPLTREEIKNTGLTSTADVVRTLPQLQNIGIDESRTSGSQDASTNRGRGTALNLRGLGSNATLLLVDGRRIAPSGTVSAFGDPNQIPIAALERIEVVTDGASAVYGTDAVGGVVNFILRKNFDGAEVTGRYSTTDGYDQYGVSAVVGKTWSRGNFVLAYDHEDRSAMLRSASPFLSQDLRQFGGNDYRIDGTNVSAAVPVIVAQNGSVLQYYSVARDRPDGDLTAADLIPGADVVDTADFTDYLPERKRDSVTAFVNYDLTPGMKLYYQGFYNARDSINQSYSIGSLTVPADNPYYIEGVPGVAPGAALTVRYPWAKDFGRKWLIATERSYSNTLGLTADLPADWRMDLYGTYASAENCQCEEGPSSGIINTTALNALLRAGDPSFNPFSPDPISDEVRARIFGANRERNTTTLTDIVAKFDGPLFDLPAGQVRAAVGGEYLEVKGEYRNAGTTTRIDNAYIPTYTADKTREVTSVFGEVFAPLIAPEMGVPLVNRLDLSLAARYERYSDFGDTTNPKIGLTWEPVQDLTVRGTWGKSFRAPSLQENNEDVVTMFIPISVPNGAGDPTIPVTNVATGTSAVLARIQGGNNNLVPEKATTYSLGFDYAPQWLDGLTLAATYYNIEYKDKIVTLGDQLRNFLATAQNRTDYADYIVAAPQPATCVEGDPSTYNPVYVPFVTAPYPIPFTGTPFCSLTAYLNGQAQNFGLVEQDGLDIQARYVREIPAGVLSTSIAWTEILNLKQTLSPSSGLVDVLDTLNNPVSRRVRGQIGLRRGPINANLFINYTGSYMNTAPVTVGGVLQPVSRVSNWMTFDATAAYELRDFGPTWADGVRFSVSIQNLTDEDPNVVLSGTSAFDNQQANPYGRIWSFEISKRW